MPVPSSGIISIQDLIDEFGGTGAVKLSDYYSGGSLVPAGTTNVDGDVIPTSGQVSLSDYYGATAVYIPDASGGSESTINSGGKTYRVHVFTTSAVFTVNSSYLLDVEYLVIAGGGGGGADTTGGSWNFGGASGGGAGGYRSSVVGEASGGGSSAETRITLGNGPHVITVGAGGLGTEYSGTQHGTNGSSSSIGSTISTVGGGNGGSSAGTYGYGGANSPLYLSINSDAYQGRDGGSGGSAMRTETTYIGSGTPDEGFDGSTSITNENGGSYGAQGGGASAVGQRGQWGNPESENGISGSITGTSTHRGRGGAGCTAVFYGNTERARRPSTGDGGQGGNVTSATLADFGTGYTGLDGIVIIRYEI